MLFNSVSFLLFFPLVCIIYYILPYNKLRTWFLLIASYYFYMNLNPYCALILLGSTLITYVGGVVLATSYCKSVQKRRYVVGVIVLFNILLLGYFKYADFVVSSFADMMNLCGFNVVLKGFDILLPVGISFYIFKAISYIVDVYNRKIQAERSFDLLALYMAFFPQLLAGPIERAENLIPQFKTKTKFDGCNVTTGLKMMLWGYFLKLVFADRAVIYVDAVYGNLYNHNGTTILLAAILYSVQIYCDFAGYSLLSIGVAKTMGFHVMQNFNRPYFAKSITDLWKRWHISLTKWLTDYVYIPLGGSRCSRMKTYRNIMVTFLVSGLWHGAAWNYVIWGGIHGFVQIVEKSLGIARLNSTSYVFNTIRILMTFLITTFAWMFFRLSNFNDAIYGIGQIFISVGKPFMSRDATPALEFCALGFIFIVVKEFLDEYFPNEFKLFDNKYIVVRYFSYIMILLLILAAGVFDDSQFIYMQF